MSRPAASDPHDLARFLRAQESAYDTAIAELQAGQKRTHWMWFVFPQLRGLGRSETALHFGIASLDEARAYLAHPLLGPRLVAATQAVLAHRDRPLRDIFGAPDDLKFRSTMTLFARAAHDPQPFRAALDACCGGADDARTLAILDG